TFQEKADFAAKGQQVFERALVQIAGWLSEKTGTHNIVYAGGCALNCVANSKVLEAGYHLFIPAAPHDGGTSLGCAIYGAIEYYHLENQFNWQRDYLGPCVNIDEVKSLLKDYPDLRIEKPNDLIDECANYLCTERYYVCFKAIASLGRVHWATAASLQTPGMELINSGSTHLLKEGNGSDPLRHL